MLMHADLATLQTILCMRFAFSPQALTCVTFARETLIVSRPLQFYATSHLSVMQMAINKLKAAAQVTGDW